MSMSTHTYIYGKQFFLNFSFLFSNRRFPPVALAISVTLNIAAVGCDPQFFIHILFLLFRILIVVVIFFFLS